MADFSVVTNLKLGAAIAAGTATLVSFIVGAQDDPDLLRRLAGAAGGAAVFALALLRFPALATRNRFALFVVLGISLSSYPTSTAGVGPWFGRGLSTAAIVGLSCLLIHHGLDPFIQRVPTRWRALGVLLCTVGVAAVSIAPILDARSLDGRWNGRFSDGATIQFTLRHESSRLTGDGVFVARNGVAVPISVRGTTALPYASLVIKLSLGEWAYSSYVGPDGNAMWGEMHLHGHSVPTSLFFASRHMRATPPKPKHRRRVRCPAPRR